MLSANFFFSYINNALSSNVKTNESKEFKKKQWILVPCSIKTSIWLIELKKKVLVLRFSALQLKKKENIKKYIYILL